MSTRLRPRWTTRTFVIVALAVTLVIAGIVSFYASSSPDGLERVAATQGFDHTATKHQTDSGPFAGYQTSGVQDARLSGGLAGVVGVAATGVLMAGLLLVLRRRGTRATDLPAPDAPPDA